MNTASLLEQAISEALSHPDITALHIDLGAVTLCDAAGVNALTTGMTAAARNNITYRIVNPHGIVRHILTITDVLIPTAP